MNNRGYNVSKAQWIELQTKQKLPQKLTLELFVAHGWKDEPYLDLPNGQQIINFKR
jgi:hypothetical protein